jgi:hypothetical protein
MNDVTHRATSWFATELIIAEYLDRVAHLISMLRFGFSRNSRAGQGAPWGAAVTMAAT